MRNITVYGLQQGNAVFNWRSSDGQSDSVTFGYITYMNGAAKRLLEQAEAEHVKAFKPISATFTKVAMPYTAKPRGVKVANTSNAKQ